MKLSTEPFSKFEAIFNLEMIKERNRPKLPKSDMPKAPFFLFDLEKVIAGDLEGTNLLKPTFSGPARIMDLQTTGAEITDLKT